MAESSVRNEDRRVEDELRATGLCCNLDLLQFYDGKDILEALFWKDEAYRLIMLYAEDAIIHDAYIRLEQWDGSMGELRASVHVDVRDREGSSRFSWCMALEA